MSVSFYKNFVYNLSDLSTYRTQMMGIATLMIIICHSCCGTKVIMPEFLEKKFFYGCYGVDIFLFLSGIGLYYSLSNKGKNHIPTKDGTLSFYKKRFYRIYISYLLAFTPFCLIFFLLDLYSVKDCILCISTLEYWLFRRGAWFVSLILLLYLIAPFLYRVLVGKYRWIIAMGIIIVLMILGCLPIEDMSTTSVLFNIQAAFSRVPSFIAGLAIGRSCKEGKQINIKGIAIFFVVSIVVSSILGSWNCIWLIVLMVLYILTPMIKWSKGTWIDTSLIFLGKISYESYLTNITLNSILIALIPAHITSPVFYGRYLEYTIVIFAGLFLANIIRNVSQKIIKRLYNT